MTYDDSVIDQDKKGEALKEQRFRMLEDIARELSGEVVFPTYFDAILRLRTVLDDPRQSIAGISKAVSLEPLVSAKLLNLANSAAFNPEGRKVVDLKTAITRLGLETVRSTAMAIAMRQLMRAKSMADFADMTHRLWDHSIQTAATARVLAARLTRFNPEEAALAGMIHDLGAFYMLYRATQYEELRKRPDSVRYLIIRWHESIGISLLGALGLPEEIIEATADHDHPRNVPEPIRSLSDVIYLANLLSGGQHEWLEEESAIAQQELVKMQEKYAELMPEIETVHQEMLNILGKTE